MNDLERVYFLISFVFYWFYYYKLFKYFFYDFLFLFYGIDFIKLHRNEPYANDLIVILNRIQLLFSSRGVIYFLCLMILFT